MKKNFNLKDLKRGDFYISETQAFLCLETSVLDENKTYPIKHLIRYKFNTLKDLYLPPNTSVGHITYDRSDRFKFLIT